jgi:hypothetical protein
MTDGSVSVKVLIWSIALAFCAGMVFENWNYKRILSNQIDESMEKYFERTRKRHD